MEFFYGRVKSIVLVAEMYDTTCYGCYLGFYIVFSTHQLWFDALDLILNIPFETSKLDKNLK